MNRILVTLYDRHDDEITFWMPVGKTKRKAAQTKPGLLAQWERRLSLWLF